MRGKQKDEARIGVVGRWPVGIVPEQITKARRRRTHVGVRVVPVDAPRLQRPLHDEVVSRAPNVVHDFFAAPFLKRFANARAKSFQHFIPRSARPLPCSARPAALHRIQHAIRIVNLVDGRRTLGAQPPAARRMHGIAFELGDLPDFLVDVGQQSAGRFAVEADRGNKIVVLLDAARPGLGIEFDPVVPLLYRRTVGEMAAVAFELMTHSESPKTLCGDSRLGCPPSVARLPVHSALTVGHALPGHHEAPFKNQQARPAPALPRTPRYKNQKVPPTTGPVARFRRAQRRLPRTSS